MRSGCPTREGIESGSAHYAEDEFVSFMSSATSAIAAAGDESEKSRLSGLTFPNLGT